MMSIKTISLIIFNILTEVLELQIEYSTVKGSVRINYDYLVTDEDVSKFIIKEVKEWAFILREKEEAL